VTYAGGFANALGNLNPSKKENLVVQDDAEEPEKAKGRWVKWRTLILRCWAELTQSYAPSAAKR